MDFPMFASQTIEYFTSFIDSVLHIFFKSFIIIRDRGEVCNIRHCFESFTLNTHHCLFREKRTCYLLVNALSSRYTNCKTERCSCIRVTIKNILHALKTMNDKITINSKTEIKNYLRKNPTFYTKQGNLSNSTGNQTFVFIFLLLSVCNFLFIFWKLF